MSDIIDAMPQRLMDAAQELLSELLDEAIDRTGEKKGYDSPIERAMAVALVFMSKVRFPEFGFYPEHGLGEAKVRSLMEHICRPLPGRQSRYGCVFPQVVIGKYRVDFLVLHAQGMDGYGGTIVECDGHEFHEKTKEQAAKDKKRDRELQERGYRVYRYTGAEIFANMYDCAHEVLSSVHGRSMDALHARTFLPLAFSDPETLAKFGDQ